MGVAVFLIHLLALVGRKICKLHPFPPAVLQRGGLIQTANS